MDPLDGENLPEDARENQVKPSGGSSRLDSRLPSDDNLLECSILSEPPDGLLLGTSADSRVSSSSADDLLLDLDDQDADNRLSPSDNLLERSIPSEHPDGLLLGTRLSFSTDDQVQPRRESSRLNLTLASRLLQNQLLIVVCPTSLASISSMTIMASTMPSLMMGRFHQASLLLDSSALISLHRTTSAPSMAKGIVTTPGEQSTMVVTKR
jgi:hypothetical protein